MLQIQAGGLLVCLIQHQEIGPMKKNYLINILGLKAVKFGVKFLLYNEFGHHKNILSDNTTTVACINKMGTKNQNVVIN